MNTIPQSFSHKWFYIKLLMVSCCYLVTACSSSHKKTVHEKVNKSSKPNVIFILVDDMGWGDVGAFYQNQRKEADSAKPYERSPNLDKLANDGVKLTNHYCAAPVCAPSRASLLSGLSQGHANVRDNQFDKALADNHTLGSVMQKAGYATAAIGKWGLQGDRNRWPSDSAKYSNGDKWPGHPLNRGFDYFLGYMRHSDGHEHYPKEGLYSGSKQVWKNGKNIADSLDKCYTADLWTAAAKQWITNHQQSKQSDQPFFMYLAYDTPHAVLELPTQAYPSGGGLHGGLQWTGKKGHMITTASGTPDSWVHPDYAKATYDDDGDPSTSQVAWPDVYKRYATATRRIDSGVGDLRQLLRDLHIDDNTIIVFSSDNGPSKESYLNHKQRKVNKDKQFHPNAPTFFRSYGPFDGIKRDTWEGGVREPTIAWWKGHIPSGRTIDAPSIQYDWLPTFMDAADLPAPANADGFSLLPSLTGQGKQHEEPVYVEYYHHGKTPGYEDFAKAHQGRQRKQMQMIRMGDHVGVRYNVQSASDDLEIYNVRKDPGQRNNLAANPERPPLINELQQKMKDKVLQMRMPNSSAQRPYDDALIPAVNVEQISPGVQWKAYEGKLPWVAKVTTLTATDSGQAARPMLRVHPGDNQELYFTGYIKIPKGGKYTFSLRSDTGALLRLHEATVIDADYGYTSGSERSGTVRLEAGLHPFRLYYLRGTKGKPSLDFEWSGADTPQQIVPASVFFYKKDE